MTNQEILDKLIMRETDANTDPFDAKKQSYNGAMVKKYLRDWNNDESTFPIDDIRRYIRLNEWKKDDFNPSAEIILSRILPKWFLLVYHELEFFRRNPRRELTKNQEALGKLYGHPMSTQDEKAFTMYEYFLQLYLNKVE